MQEFFVGVEQWKKALDTPIWRYVDILQFLVLLEQRSLHFALLKELEDAWEAALSKRLKDSIIRGLGDKAIPLFTLVPHHIAISCWHENCSESVAMWSLYTSKGHGIAIQTTVGRLIESLKGSAPEVYIGRVTYEDHFKEYSQLHPRSQLNTLMSVFQKRECFRHESELRAITLIIPEVPAGTTPGHAIDLPYPLIGTLLAIDLNTLVQRVVVSSSFPRWGYEVVQSAMNKVGLDLTIQDSAISLQPSRSWTLE